MMLRKIAILIGLAGWLGLLPASFAAADNEAIPRAAVVLPAPALSPDTPPTPAVTNQPPTSLAPPVDTPAPRPVRPARVKTDYTDADSDQDSEFFDTTAWPSWAATAWESSANVVHNHLRIGVRYRQIKLDDNKRNPDDSFLGSITELNTQSDYEPITWLTFDWLFCRYFGVRFAYDQLRAQTQTSQENISLNHSDGNVDLFGPGLMLLLRYPNKFHLVPTVGIGYSWLNATFEHNPAWHNGFGGENREAAYSAWVASGSPAWPNGGYQRTITLKDTTAVTLYGELAYQITDRLDIYGFVQSMDVNGVDLTFDLSSYGNVFESTQAQFPMSNTAYGAGLRWTF